MKLSRDLIIAGVALATSVAASVAPAGAAPAVDRTSRLPRPLALLELAQADHQATSAVTEEQRAEIKSALQNLSPQDVKQAALDIMTGVDQYIHGVASSGTQEQKERLAARVHRAFRVWRKDHSDAPTRDDLELLLIQIAETGVPVDQGIIPAVQHAREAAATRPPAVTEEQRAEIKSALETLSPEDVKQAAIDIVTVAEQYAYHVKTSGTQEEKARLAERIHRAFVVWRKEHGDAPVRSDLEQLLIGIAAAGASVEQVIIPAVQNAREVAATRQSSAPERPAEPVIVHRR